MAFISRFVREQKRYTKDELCSLFCLDESERKKFIRDLKAYGILKAVKNTKDQLKMSDLQDEDYEIADVDSFDVLYVFTYVGVVIAGSRVIKSYPKYIKLNTEPLETVKLILKVLRRYGSKEQTISIFNESEGKKVVNILAVILALMTDYYQYGLYTNTENIIEENGEGPILWDKTINDGFALLQDGRPYYLDTYTKKTIDNEQDYFLRLHKCILTECSRQLEDTDLLSLFELTGIYQSEEEISNFGDTDYILYRLETELNTQFNTRKQNLLKMMYAYIAGQQVALDGPMISMYGTGYFNLVWQDVCSEVLTNMLNTPFTNLNMGEYNINGTSIQCLKDVIEKPKWNVIDSSGKSFTKMPVKTLEPDIINIYDNAGTKCFAIFDAKYYDLQLGKNGELSGQPGVEDITKQYLYQMAYQDFIRQKNIPRVINCFLMPTEENNVINAGTASMDMFEKLGFNAIQVRKLPATTMYNNYLNRRNMDLSLLSL